MFIDYGCLSMTVHRLIARYVKEILKGLQGVQGKGGGGSRIVYGEICSVFPSYALLPYIVFPSPPLPFHHIPS